jgi:hypothetical protein
MKLTIEIELPDDIQPCCIHDCSIYCPFGYLDWEDGEHRCDHMERGENGWECIISNAMKKGERNE